MTDAPSQLGYGVDPRNAPRTFRRVTALVVIAAIGFAGWRLGPGVFMQFEHLRIQRMLMTHELPADQVVLSIVPDEAERLFKQGYLHVDVGLRRIGVPVSRDATLTAAGYRSPGVVAAGPFLNKSLVGAGVFMHSRRSLQSGEERLVLIEAYFMEERPDVYALKFNATVAQPATTSIGSRMTTLTGGTQNPYLPEPPLRLYAGQADPADAGHFTIPFDTASGHFVLHGRLSNGNSVDWEVKPADK